MRSAIHILIILFILPLMIISCRKGDLQEKRYFGKISMSIKELPGSSTVMLYFDNEKIDSIQAGRNDMQFPLPAGKQGKLALYDARQGQFLADTLITIPRDSTLQFNFAYGPEIGIEKFVGKEGTRVDPDSVYVQFYNNLDPNLYPKKKYGLQIVRIDPETGEFSILPTKVLNMEWKKLHPEILKIKLYNDNRFLYTYAAQLTDPDTGEVITQPDGFEYISGFPSGDYYSGKFMIQTIYFNVPNNSIELIGTEM